MEIASIEGDEVLLLYHPADSTAEVGEQFAILELPSVEGEPDGGEETTDQPQDGLVVQVIRNESLQYAGLQQENIQRVIEDRIADIDHTLDQESGMTELKNLKVATAKIRKRIRDGEWEKWGGWIPTRNVEVNRIQSEELLDNIIPDQDIPLDSFTRFEGTPVRFDGTRLDMINAITGVKGTGKSHLAKLITTRLSDNGVPVTIYDINGEYTVLPNSQNLVWGENFIPSLDEIGYEILETVVNSIYPLKETSSNVFSNNLPHIWAARREYTQNNNLEFKIDIDYLRSRNWTKQQHVEGAIDRRLSAVQNMDIFKSYGSGQDPEYTSLQEAYETSCNEGRPIVFDMRETPSGLRRALVEAMNGRLEDICAEEAEHGSGRYPFVFFEEAHFYVSDSNILDIITRARHIGIASFFITNTPQELPDPVFRQIDNLFLLGLSHNDDIRSVGRNSFTDEETIESFATRMPRHHGLMMGKITDRYPLMVGIDDLPDEVPATGETRSTWDRFTEEDTTPPDDEPDDAATFEPDDDLPF